MDRSQGAADYLLEHHVTGPMFNTYEQGGYLIWEVGPRSRCSSTAAPSAIPFTGITTRSCSMPAPTDQVAGPRKELLDRYGVQVVVMNTMDYVFGCLVLAGARPRQPRQHGVGTGFMTTFSGRDIPTPSAARDPVLSNKLGRVLRHLDRECAVYIENSPETPLCARTLADYWLRNEAWDAAHRMLTLYLSHAERRDEQAERALQKLDAASPPSNNR